MGFGQRALIGAAGLLAALAVTGTVFAQSLNSASYTVNGNMISWKVTLSGLTVGDVLTFTAGPESPPAFPLTTVGSTTTDVSETVTSATETFSFTSAIPSVPYDGQNYAVALYYLQGTETTSTGGSPMNTNVLDLTSSGVGQLPEAPWAAALPIVGLAGVAAVWSRQRRLAPR